jgi:heptosyltransferase-3
MKRPTGPWLQKKHEPHSRNPRWRDRRFHSYSASAQDFATFDLIINYLYDPDRIFEKNLRRCGVENLLCGPAKIVETSSHAARQLAQPMEQLGITVADLTEQIFFSADDRQFARAFLGNLSRPIVAIHPGSGSEKKNWPLQNWIELFSSGGDSLIGGKCFSLLVISGEADQTQTEQLKREWRDPNVRFAEDLPLPHLVAVLEQSIFIGHDSGISHLAAAAGANCLLLFGPTDPNVWAPQNKNVRVLRAPNGRLSDLGIEPVEAAVGGTLCSH